MRTLTLAALLAVSLLATTFAPEAHAFARSRARHAAHLASMDARIVHKAIPRVRGLTRDLTLFHYSPRPASDRGYHAPEAAWALDRVNRAIRFQWNEQARPTVHPYLDWFGEGLYAATDPVVSRSYVVANAMDWVDDNFERMPWFLTVITLVPETRFLDLTANVPFDSVLIRDLAREGCDATQLYQLMILAKEDARACRPFARRLLRTLQIEAVAYTWANADGFIQELCPGARQVAFYLTAQRALAPEQVRLLSANLPGPEGDSADELRLLIQETMARTSPYRPLWPALATRRPSKPVESWVRDELFACGNHAEDR